MVKKLAETPPLTLRESLDDALQQSLTRATGHLFRQLILATMSETVTAAAVTWLRQVHADDPQLSLSQLVARLEES